MDQGDTGSLNGTEPSVTDMPGDPMGPRQSESFGGVGGGEAGDRRGSKKSQIGLKDQFSARLGGRPVFGAE